MSALLAWRFLREDMPYSDLLLSREQRTLCLFSVKLNEHSFIFFGGPNMIENKNRNQEEDNSIAVAEDSRETQWKSKSFLGAIFMGDLDLSMCYPFPEQGPEDKAIGDEWVARVDAWCAENIDGEAIDRAGEIPASVLKGLADLGMFGIKIPTEYGGLGLSQTNYMRLLAIVARYCASTVATLSAHQSIGVPQPLKLFGTKAQKEKYLPLLAKGAISAFGLTEPSVGSDPAQMKTIATPTEDGKHWILNGEKLWCTNGVIADMYVVMAATPPITKRGREIKQITAFIVERDTPGIDVMHRCRFMGLRALENGLIRFTDVKVPAENIILGEGQGLRLALTTLNDGRLGIPAIMASSIAELNEHLSSWGKSRNQWGRNIGDHESGCDKLAQLGGGQYAMAALSDFCAATSDRGDTDIRMEAAAAKMYNTELGWDLIDIGLQFMGGRGYETGTSLAERGDVSMPIERAFRDARINRIVEGTTDVMHLFLARESLDKHLKLAMPLLSPKSSIGQKFKSLMNCTMFYSRWYPMLWVGGLFTSFSRFDDDLADHMRWIDGATRKLARKLFHAMVLNGPKLEMKQLTLARIVDIGTELSVLALTASRAQSERDRGDQGSTLKAVYWLETGRHRVDALFHALKNNADTTARKLATEMMEAAPELSYPEVNLSPLPVEVGSDLTSGRQDKRLCFGGSVNMVVEQASK
jgi:alkylation response protein AidB-like acyl-CoA dehydrogenase